MGPRHEAVPAPLRRHDQSGAGARTAAAALRYIAVCCTVRGRVLGAEKRGRGLVSGPATSSRAFLSLPPSPPLASPSSHNLSPRLPSLSLPLPTPRHSQVRTELQVIDAAESWDFAAWLLDERRLEFYEAAAALALFIRGVAVSTNLLTSTQFFRFWRKKTEKKNKKTSMWEKMTSHTVRAVFFLLLFGGGRRAGQQRGAWGAETSRRRTPAAHLRTPAQPSILTPRPSNPIPPPTTKPLQPHPPNLGARVQHQGRQVGQDEGHGRPLRRHRGPGRHRVRDARGGEAAAARPGLCQGAFRPLPFCFGRVGGPNGGRRSAFVWWARGAAAAFRVWGRSRPLPARSARRAAPR